MSFQKVWELGKLNHVAIAVPDLEAACKMYRDVLGAQVSEPQVLPLIAINVGRMKIYVD